VTALPADAWVPVPIRWRHVIGGDIVLDPAGAPWHVSENDLLGTWVLQQGLREFQRQADPDEVVNVLVPVPERDAVELARDVLGARLVERRTETP
jgi:hypothetical protein